MPNYIEDEGRFERSRTEPDTWLDPSDAEGWDWAPRPHDCDDHCRDWCASLDRAVGRVRKGEVA